MDSTKKDSYGLREAAVEFPMMLVIATVYPCNFGCPNCPYTDGNSELRKYYNEHKGDRFPVDLWEKIAIEAGEYQAWLRCTGGGEPLLHPKMVDMIEFAKQQNARVWLNTNGSMFGPSEKLIQKLERIILANTDMIEFSMDAGDAETYHKARPPISGVVKDIEKRWQDQVNNVKRALDFRKKFEKTTRIVVSIIRQQLLDGKLDQTRDFWLNEIGVDEVITRKYLTWDNNTTLEFNKALDRDLYASNDVEKKEPCVWPFERLNIDTLGRIALCGQDIGFNTASQFPNLNDQSVKEIWQGEIFNWYRKKHLEGRGMQCNPCNNCSAWLAGIRDWEHGWLKVLKTSKDHLESIMKKDLGVDVEIHQPSAKIKDED